MNDFCVRCRKRWQLFLFLVPALAFIFVFAYYPMFGVQIAFRDYTPNGGIWNSDWVGLKHFYRFLSSYQFSRVLINTLRISFYNIVVNFPLAVIMALAINTVRSHRFKKVVQTITYMPHFISIVLVGMVMQMLNPVIGMYGNLYRLLFNSGYPRDILTQPGAFPHLYVWSGTWQDLGWSTIIFLAALSSTDVETHEAAKIDGATRLQRVVHIDFFSLLPTASVMLILSAGSVMDVGFEKSYLMQNSTNLSTSEVISTYVYKTGMSMGTSQFSYAAAIGLFNSVINCIVLVVVNALSSKIDGGTSLF